MHPRETVDRALELSSLGLNDCQVGRILGVSYGAVRKWRLGLRRAPDKKKRRSPCPRCDGSPLDEAAYAYLLGLYLGDGHLVRGRRDVYVLSIACCDAWPGLIEAAKDAVAAVMPTLSVFCRQRTGMTEVKMVSKHWPCLFPQHGPGPKHLRKIELADWQEDIVARYPGDFVRGLMHSDGYRGVNRVRQKREEGDRWYEYPRYLFVNHSQDILDLCGQALDRLGVEWRYSKPTTISVAKRGAVARLDEFVGPKY